MIAVHDAKSPELRRRIVLPQIGAISHLTQGPGGMLGAIPANLFPLTAAGLATAKNLLGDAPLTLSPVEEIEHKVGAPSPLLLVDPETGALRSFLDAPAKQRRAQSIVYHEAARAFFVTYPFSDYVARIQPDGASTYVSAFALGLTAVRGLATIPGDDGVYVCGQYRGIARLDATTLEVRERHDVPLYGATHLYAV